jgi:metal-responsive CopG/Arc/MetJ family transcriptional regulator
MKATRKVLTVSVPPEIASEYERLAKKEAKSRSHLFREMFQLYRQKNIERELFALQRYGAVKAVKKGVLTEEAVEKIVLEGR